MDQEPYRAVTICTPTFTASLVLTRSQLIDLVDQCNGALQEIDYASGSAPVSPSDDLDGLDPFTLPYPTQKS